MVHHLMSDMLFISSGKHHVLCVSKNSNNANVPRWTRTWLYTYIFQLLLCKYVLLAQEQIGIAKHAKRQLSIYILKSQITEWCEDMRKQLHKSGTMPKQRKKQKV